MKTLLLISTTLIPLFLFTACFSGRSTKNVSEEKIVLGTVKGGTYTNSYFGMTVFSPAGWEIITQRPIKKDNPFQVELFQAFQYPVDSGYIDNGDIYIIANRRDHNPLTRNGADYLKELKEGLEMLAVEGDDFTEITATTIGGKEFYTFEAVSVDVENQLETTQEFYATSIKNYWLMITLTYCDDEQKELLKETLGKIRFK